MSYWLHEAAEAELGDAAVYYAEYASKSIAEAGPQIYAVAHQNREPGYWQGRR